MKNALLKTIQLLLQTSGRAGQHQTRVGWQPLASGSYFLNPKVKYPIVNRKEVSTKWH